MIVDIEIDFESQILALDYTNLQNSMISFDSSWFLDKNLSNFVSLPWKLHNRYCHNCQVPSDRASYYHFKGPVELGGSGGLITPPSPMFLPKYKQPLLPEITTSYNLNM